MNVLIFLVINILLLFAIFICSIYESKLILIFNFVKCVLICVKLLIILLIYESLILYICKSHNIFFILPSYLSNNVASLSRVILIFSQHLF